MTLESIASMSDNVTVKLPAVAARKPGSTRRLPRKTRGSYTTGGT